jgi:tetratricopeptide (TPR) repeat protein
MQNAQQAPPPQQQQQVPLPQQAPPTPPLRIDYIKLTPKPRNLHDTPFHHNLTKAVYALEMLQHYEACKYFEKTIQLQPHNCLSYILRGECFQFVDGNRAIEDFNMALYLLDRYPMEQEFPASVRSLEDKQRVIQQYILLCQGFIQDTRGEFAQSIETLKHAISFVDKEYDEQLDSDPFNELIRKIDRVEDDFVMSYLYIYLNFVEQRHKVSVRLIVSHIMKSLAYGARHSSIMGVFDLMRFSAIYNEIECNSRAQFLDDMKQIDEKRCFQGLSFYINDLFVGDKCDEAISILKFFVEKYRFCGILFSLWGRCIKSTDPVGSHEAIIRAFELDPSLDTFLHLFDVEDFDDPNYLRNIELSRAIAHRRVTSDLQFRKIVGYLNFCRFLYDTVEVAKRAQAQTEFHSCLEKWKQAFILYHRREFSSFDSFEERVRVPETKYSTRVKQTLYTNPLYFDCDIISQSGDN